MVVFRPGFGRCGITLSLATREGPEVGDGAGGDIAGGLAVEIGCGAKAREDAIFALSISPGQEHYIDISMGWLEGRMKRGREG